MKEVASVIKAQHIKERHMKHEMLNTFYISPLLFVEVEGMTTTTFKLKRSEAEKYYKSQIDQMYA